MILSCFNPGSLHNYLVVSTVTYSVKIYTPNTNLNDVYQVDVMINGEDYLQTQMKTVLDPVTTPETETEGYVIYQILETVFDHFSKHRERRLKMCSTAEYFCYISKCSETWENTVLIVFYIYSIENKVRKKQRNKIVKKLV